MRYDIIKLISGKVFLLNVTSSFFFCVVFISCVFYRSAYSIVFLCGGGFMMHDMSLEIMVRFAAYYPGHAWAVNRFIGTGD